MSHSLKSRCQLGQALSERSKGSLMFYASLQTLGSRAIPSVYKRHSNLCLHLHRGLFLSGVSVSVCLLAFKDAHHIGLRAHPTPVGHHFN